MNTTDPNNCKADQIEQRSLRHFFQEGRIIVTKKEKKLCKAQN